MKLYHKNTDQLVKVGDIFHLNGVDCFYQHPSFFSQCVILVFKNGYCYKNMIDLNLEWR